MDNLRELKLRNSKECSCGHEFTANDIVELIKNNDYQFYGGRVAFYSKVECPNCHQKVVLLLEPYDNSYRIIDIGEELIEETQYIENENSSDNTIDTIEISGGFVCEKCGRDFKSKAGLTAHQKSCLKQ